MSRSGTDTWCGSISGIAGSTVRRRSSHESILEGCRFVSNHFKAVRRQIEKIRVGAKYVRKYEKVARTPYQRMLDHLAVDEAVKEKLRKEHAIAESACSEARDGHVITLPLTSSKRATIIDCATAHSLTVIYGLERWMKERRWIVQRPWSFERFVMLLVP